MDRTLYFRTYTPTQTNPFSSPVALLCFVPWQLMKDFTSTLDGQKLNGICQMLREALRRLARVDIDDANLLTAAVCQEDALTGDDLHFVLASAIDLHDMFLKSLKQAENAILPFLPSKEAPSS